MDSYLGFVVLTGPLFIVVLWVPICLTLAVLVGKKLITKSLSLKVTGGITVFLVALPLPFADEIAGRIYFNHLCETEAGVEVYQSIELPAEYWDGDGKPNFYDESNGNFFLPSEKFYKVELKKSNRRFGVKERRKIILDTNNQKIIGEELQFRYWGGYVTNNFTPHNSALRCGGNLDEFVEKQFTQFTGKDGE